MIERKDLKVGHIYKSKKPKTFGLHNFYDDRQILYIGLNDLQYDSITVKIGQRQPRISIEKFIKWADCDITEQYNNENIKEWRIKIEI